MFPEFSASHQVMEVAWQSSVEKRGKRVRADPKPQCPTQVWALPWGTFIVYLMVLNALICQTSVLMGLCWLQLTDLRNWFVPALQQLLVSLLALALSSS